MYKLFQNDLDRSRPIVLKEWKRGSLWERFKGQFGSLFNYWY